jgi:hypothetical protein
MTKCDCCGRPERVAFKVIANGVIDVDPKAVIKSCAGQRQLAAAKRLVKEENNRVPREVTRHITRSAWVDDAADYLIEIGVYKAEEFRYACDRAKAFMHWNVDEGGELVEIDAKEFLREFIREVVEE